MEDAAMIDQQGVYCIYFLRKEFELSQITKGSIYHNNGSSVFELHYLPLLNKTFNIYTMTMR